MKKILAIGAAFIVTLSTFAGFPAGSPTYVTVPTNTAVGATGSTTVAIPAINVTYSGITNSQTQITNNICGSLTNGTTVYNITVQTVYSATNTGASIASPYTTNFYLPACQAVLQSQFFLQFCPQINSNTFSVQSM
jgi:hypothetical protein